jgi:hypothetical protein
MNPHVILACMFMFLLVGIGLSMEPNPNLLADAIMESLHK